MWATLPLIFRTHCIIEQLLHWFLETNQKELGSLHLETVQRDNRVNAQHINRSTTEFRAESRKIKDVM